MFPPHLLQPEEARKAVNPYEQEILYMGAKEYAFAQADEDPFQAALDWLLARDCIMLPGLQQNKWLQKSRSVLSM